VTGAKRGRKAEEEPEEEVSEVEESDDDEDESDFGECSGGLTVFCLTTGSSHRRSRARLSAACARGSCELPLTHRVTVPTRTAAPRCRRRRQRR
jgi:hypothetical protein